MGEMRKSFEMSKSDGSPVYTKRLLSLWSTLPQSIRNDSCMADFRNEYENLQLKGM